MSRRWRRRRRGGTTRDGSRGGCECPTCTRAHTAWRAGIANYRAAGITLWVLSLFGPALSEGMIVVTGNPEGSHEALCTGVIAVPFPDSPFGIETIPLPPFEEWADPKPAGASVGAAARHAAHHLRSPGGRSARTRADR